MKKLLIYTIALFLFSCSNKSELVQRLEGVFYDNDFAKVPDQIFNTSDFGIPNDSTILATEAIQAAIDAAADAGGGKVIFPEGTYLSGAIFLKSNVELHLGEGVKIKAVQDDSQYPEKWTRIAGIEMDWPSALINVYQQKNVRITGKGIIDGNGKYWWDKFWGDPPRSGGMWEKYKEYDIRWAVDYDCKRVRPVVVFESEDVLLKDFTVQRAGFWTVSLTYSQRVYVDGLVIRNNIGGFGPSSDGVNTDSSSDVLVENCDIDCNDDNLCIKSGRDADGLRVNRPAENIVYRNCITRAGHGLFTIGSETSGGMRNVEVYGLEAIGTNTGIRFKSAQVRGGLIENIYFHDIKMTDVNSPFHFELNWYPEYSYPKIPADLPEEMISERMKILTRPVMPPECGIPEFRDIRISDIYATGAEEAIYANAYPEKPMSYLTWKNTKIEAKAYGEINHATHWKFQNVEIISESNDSLNIMNGKAMDLPGIPIKETNYEPAANKLEAIDLIFNQRISGGNIKEIVVLDVENGIRMEEGDTLGAIKMIAAVFEMEDARIKFYEPLGDGFYVSPISIEITKGHSIKINSQKEHEWKFSIPYENQPDNVEGADSWEYLEEAKRLNITKTGKTFQLSVS